MVKFIIVLITFLKLFTTKTYEFDKFIENHDSIILHENIFYAPIPKIYENEIKQYTQNRKFQKFNQDNLILYTYNKNNQILQDIILGIRFYF